MKVRCIPRGCGSGSPQGMGHIWGSQARRLVPGWPCQTGQGPGLGFGATVRAQSRTLQAPCAAGTHGSLDPLLARQSLAPHVGTAGAGKKSTRLGVGGLGLRARPVLAPRPQRPGGRGGAVGSVGLTPPSPADGAAHVRLPGQRQRLPAHCAQRLPLQRCPPGRVRPTPASRAGVLRISGRGRVPEAACRSKPTGTAHTGRHSSAQRWPLWQPGEGTCEPAVLEPGRTSRPIFCGGRALVGCDPGNDTSWGQRTREHLLLPWLWTWAPPGLRPLARSLSCSVMASPTAPICVLVRCQAGRRRDRQACLPAAGAEGRPAQGRGAGGGAASSGSSAARLGSSGLPTAPSPAGAPWPLPAAPNHAFVAPRHSSLGHQTGLAGCAPRPGRQLSAPLTSTRSPCRQTAPRTGAALPSANLITQKIPFLPL